MKIGRGLRPLLLTTVAVATASCGSLSSPDAAAGARFGEAARADVIVRFFGWNSIHVVQPDVRENGFLPLLNRDTVAAQFDRPDVGRGLAVVVFGYMFTKTEEADLVRDWSGLFAGRGFRRVVFLRAGFKNNIDGLLILHDSAMTARHDGPGTIATTLAVLPAAAGTNVAHSSSRTVR